ncbi:MAG: hypothetical protein ACOC3V_04215 [bacterium]
MNNFYKIDYSNKNFYYFEYEENKIIRATSGSFGKWKIDILTSNNPFYEKKKKIDAQEIPKDTKIKFIEAIFKGKLL